MSEPNPLAKARAAFTEAKAEIARAEGLFDGAFTEAKRALLIRRLAEAQRHITAAHRNTHLTPAEPDPLRQAAPATSSASQVRSAAFLTRETGEGDRREAVEGARGGGRVIDLTARQRRTAP